jgi:regulator of RNase E activity RraA
MIDEWFWLNRKRGTSMKKSFTMFAAVVLFGMGLTLPVNLRAASVADQQLYEDFKQVEVASVADAMEQLYGQRNYMAHSMRPLAPTKFAGPAVTVLLKKEEHKEGSKASQGMLDAIDTSAAGSVYVMVLEDGENYAGIGGLMATALKARGFAGAVIDGGVRDLPQIQKLQFPVFSRSIVPSTTINHYRFAGSNIAVTCAGVRVAANDIIVADMDGVAVVPRAKAEEVLKKAQELDTTEHSMIPFIEKYRSINEAVDKFGRI